MAVVELPVSWVVEGAGAGDALVSDAPLGFWGGYDAATGEIIDRRHPLSGQSAAGRVLVVPFTKGSSTGAAILLEAVRAGVAPAAILTSRVDTFLALASVVAQELYDRPVPLAIVDDRTRQAISSGMRVECVPKKEVILLSS